MLVCLPLSFTHLVSHVCNLFSHFALTVYTLNVVFANQRIIFVSYYRPSLFFLSVRFSISKFVSLIVNIYIFLFVPSFLPLRFLFLLVSCFIFFTHDYQHQISSEPLDTLNIHLNFDSMKHPGNTFFFSLLAWLLNEGRRKKVQQSVFYDMVAAVGCEAGRGKFWSKKG